MKTIVRSIAVVAGVAASSFVASVCQAQSEVKSTQTYTVQTDVAPIPIPSAPKLGIVTVNADSLEIMEVIPYSPATRLGLEAGDRILQINGRPVRTVYELQTALRSAVYNNNGQIRVLIDNVRARFGEYGAQRYVQKGTFLDGYAHLAGVFPNNQPVVTAATN